MSEPLRVLDLFSGIGGFSLGLERAGMKTVGFCEIEPFCRKVLAKHWPEVWIHDDIRTLTACLVLDRCGSIDLVCGGFPCTDISNAGRRAGIGGKSSGLWTEMCRVIGELRPQYALVENVAALIGRGLDRVLGDLAEIGYDAEWNCIPASAVGAPHLRDRIWLLAYPACGGLTADGRTSGSCGHADECGAIVPDGESQQKRAAGSEVAAEKQSRRVAGRSVKRISHPQLPRLERTGLRRAIADSPVWLPEPGLVRVVDGVSGLVDRLAALGNAVVPQVVECIGRSIIAAHAAGAK